MPRRDSPPTLSRRWRLVGGVALLVAAALTSGGCSLVPTAEQLQGVPVPVQILLLVAGTLISEDLVCVLVGVMIRKGQIDPWVGGFGCFIGIYVGDLLFFALGRLGGAKLLKVKWFSRGFGEDRLASFGEWFDRRPWAAIAMCRVLPGIRVPLYLAVGALTKRTAAFFVWTALFAFVWTPALIALVALLGDAFVAPFEKVTGGRAWLAIPLGAVTLYLVLRLILKLSTSEGRTELRSKFRSVVSRASARRRSERVEGSKAEGRSPRNENDDSHVDNRERRPAEARETGAVEQS